MGRLPAFRGRVLVALCALLAACSSPEERFAEHLLSAEALVETGELDNAILEYRSALRIDPEDAEVNLRLADLLLEAGDRDATFYYGEAWRLAPDRGDVATRLVRLLLVQGDTVRAAELLDRVSERFPDLAALHSARSELELARGKAEAAIEAALEATRLEPEDASAWMQLGRAYRGKARATQLTGEGDTRDAARDAIAAYERGDELAGGSVPAQIEIAKLRGMRTTDRRQRLAEQGFRKAYALAVEQGDLPLQLMAAEAAAEHGRQAKNPTLTRWALAQIVEVDPERLSAWRRLVEVVDSQTRLGGVAFFPKLLEQQPDRVEVHLMYANYLAEKDRTRQAIQHLQSQIARGLDSPQLWETLIRLKIRESKLANARATYVRMADRHPDDDTTRRVQARIALAEGHPEKAAKILRSLAGQSEDPETQKLLAFAEWRLGNLPNATAAADRAFALSGRFAPEILRLKARIHNDAGEWRLALRALASLRAARAGISSEERLIAVRALYATGKPSLARTELLTVLRTPDAPPAAAVAFARHEGAENPEEARAHLSAAAQRAPRDHEVIEAMTELDMKSGNPTAALVRLNQLLRGRRVDPAMLMLRARLLAGSGKYEQAEADALRAFEAEPDMPGAVDLLFSIYSAQGRLEEAQRSFEEAEEAGVLHVGARLLLARIHLARGDDAKARETLERVLREKPSMAAAKNELALLLAKDGQDLDRALRLAEEVQQAESTNGDAANTVGYVYYRKGLHEAALQQIRYAIELAEDSRQGVPPSFHYHLGLTLRALGREGQAVAAFEAALAGERDFADADDARLQLDDARASASARAS